VFNELTTLLINYSLFCLTEWTHNSVHSDIGNSVIVVTCGNIAINFLFILIPLVIY